MSLIVLQYIYYDVLRFSFTSIFDEISVNFHLIYEIHRIDVANALQHGHHIIL